ncbi:hypothetical protein [Azotobacter chroococcum]|uniref:hypothetical protein n=1 Tax=Azotobacter chroococcum TaxID=353 RepID=UPI0005855D1B|nr:hypothetical protein [Azotobacter chroococcum]
MATKTRKRCKVCGDRFYASRSTAIYCSDTCRKAADRAKEEDKDSALLKSLSNTGFFSYLTYQCKRAGTVEVVPTQLESLVELHSVYVYNNKANAYKSEKEYELSHIHPVKVTEGRIGSLHPSNIVVQPLKFNRSHGSKYLGGGHSINAYRLKSEYKIDDGDDRNTIIKKIFKRIGVTTLKQFKKIAKPATLALIKELAWFDRVCLLDKTIKLNEMSVVQLRELKASLTGTEPFNLSFSVYAHHEVLLHELKRLSVHRPELIPVVEWYATIASLYDDSVWWWNDAGDKSMFDMALALLQPILAGADTPPVATLQLACQNAATASVEALAAENEAKRLQAESENEAFWASVPDIDNWLDSYVDIDMPLKQRTQEQIDNCPF